MSRQDDDVKTDKSDCDSVAQKPISNLKNGEGGTVSTRFRVDYVNIMYAPVCFAVRSLH